MIFSLFSHDSNYETLSVIHITDLLLAPSFATFPTDDNGDPSAITSG